MKLSFLAQREFYFFSAYYSTVGFFKHKPPIYLPLYSQGSQYIYFLDEDNYSSYSFRLWKKVQRSPIILTKIEKQITENKNNTIKNLKNLRPEILTNLQLLKEYKKIINYFMLYESKANPVIRLLDIVGVPKLKSALVSRKVKNPDYAVTTLTAAENPSYQAIEEEKFWKGALTHIDRNKFFKNHLRKFAYVTLSFYNEPPLTTKDLKKRLREVPKNKWLQKARQTQASLTKTKAAKESLVHKYHLGTEAKKVILILSKSAELKDLFRGYLSELWFHGEKVFQEIAKRLHTTTLSIKSSTAEELGRALLKNHNLNKLLIRKRIHGPTVYLVNSGGIKILYDEKARKAIKKYFANTTSKGLKEFIGRPGSLGKAKGRIRVAHSLQEAKAIKKGEILVVSNTNPAYVPYLHKVSAIITEEGGITIHAAIIAREMGIPCIVGISNARTIFKNGQLVTVDANKGVVRKL